MLMVPAVYFPGLELACGRQKGAHTSETKTHLSTSELGCLEGMTWLL